MKITFRLRFFTHFGQSLFLCGNDEALGAGQIEKAIPLRYVDPEFWEAAVEFPAAPNKKISYRYVLRNPDGSTVEDWEDSRAINPASFKGDELLVIDSWNDTGAIENAFYTEPFKTVLLKPEQPGAAETAPLNATHTFKVKAPLLKRGETLCILGSGAALGNWNTLSSRLLNRAPGEDFLTAQLDLSKETFPLEYKYGVYSVEHGSFVRYEDGPNRVLPADAKQSAADLQLADQRTGESSADYKSEAHFHVLVNDGFVRLPATMWRGAGVAIPVFSLRSEKSFGVGEFTDLKPLADWGKKVGLKLIQILPVNDSTATHTWLDSYPYAAISAFALHPLYLNLSSMAAKENQSLLKKLEAERKRLNALDTLDYEPVMKAKREFIRQIFPSQKERTFASADYREFFEKNKHWLKPYAAFCWLRDKFGSADFRQWPAHQTYCEAEIEALIANENPGTPPSGRPAASMQEHAGETPAIPSQHGVRREIELNYFIQFHLHRQLREAVEYAHEQGLILKGDLAIGVSPRSADVWQNPELFHTSVQAGAPPDPFSDKGQNWGFPTYNWPRMKQDGFAWWRRRFEQMSVYFDAFRIDHILGFFRIWSVPAQAVEGILGYFVPAIPLRVEEFQQRQIPFNRDRYVNPFITDEVLREMFGVEAEEVKHTFLNLEAGGHYSLKPELATQRQVENYFAQRNPGSAGFQPASSSGAASNRQDAGAPRISAKLKLGLFDLISNVILLEVETPDGPEYHFRFFVDRTTSFKHLDPQTQAQLRELYVDYFFRRQDAFWMQEAMQKLPAFKRVTNMLICGEDLGLVPDCVPEVMKQLGLLSLEVQRMPKQPGRDFSRPAEAPYLSVVTPSTHDMSTIRGWWEEDRSVTQKFFNTELSLSGEAPPTCSGVLNEAVIAQHLASPAMWSIFQLQDLLGMDEQLRRADSAAERINIPANPRNYWQYRMHLTVEALQQTSAFNEKLRTLISTAGR